MKVHRDHEPYCRVRDAYALLWRLKVTEVLGFHVPQLLHAEDDLLAIEMSIVTRPFVLDFAGAYLDKKPMFGREIWEEWEHEKQEQFGAQWPAVRRVLDEFDSMGIHLLDVTPNNISFAE